MSFEPHQERVIEERDQLANRGDALEAFIVEDNPVYTKLPPAERGRLNVQLHIMEAYMRVLNDRIFFFTPQDAE